MERPKRTEEAGSMKIEDMKLANCMLDGTPVLVMSSDDRLYNLTAGLEAAKAEPASTTDELLKAQYRQELLMAACSAAKMKPSLEGKVTFRPGVISPEKIVVVGLNYRKHALEANMPIPEVPCCSASLSTPWRLTDRRFGFPPIRTTTSTMRRS
jgi:2-keto-4-pentenoate hydratase/2-oxohepta-3-ene-1,7-dioic acid hydratase in catechol pathway